MKGKVWVSLILIWCLSLTLVVPVLAVGDITVKLDGTILSFDISPQIIGGRTMVPMRKIFEAMGATVQWEAATQSVSAFNEQYYVKASINNTQITVNGETKTMDVPPLLINGYTLVPARFVAESFGASVEWDAATSTVYIWDKKSTGDTVAKESKVPKDFTQGYEMAAFSKFNSFASENGLGETKIYLDCKIENVDVLDSEKGDIYWGYLVDNNQNKWLAMLHSALFSKKQSLIV